MRYLGAMLLLTSAMLGSEAKAVTAAIYTVQGDIGLSTGASPQSFKTYFFGGTLDGSEGATTTDRPAASADVVSGGCTSGYAGAGCAGGSLVTSAEVYYYIYVSGTSGAEVPYYFDTAGDITVTGLYAGGSASVSLIAPPGVGFVASTTVNGSIYCGANGCVNSVQHVELESDTQYLIEVYASAYAGTNNAASVLAGADPYIYIDPAFPEASEFSLLISPGIGNSPVGAVPEPSTWAIMLIGFAGLGLAGYRKTRKLEKKSACSAA